MFSLLQDRFVVGWKNIAREDYVGSSHGYTCEDSAVGTTNGAGPRNTQIFVLSPGGVVLHALPGFWHPEDLAHELRFALVLHRLWRDKGRSRSEKDAMFRRLQLSEIRQHPAAMTARSGWQGFDQAEEMHRIEAGQPRDTVLLDPQGRPTGQMKSINVLVHERMAARPFLPFGRFDVAAFADYGRDYYDNNARASGHGVQFGTKGYMESQKRQAERDRRRAEKKARKAGKTAAAGG